MVGKQVRRFNSLPQCAARIPEAGEVLDILEKCPERQRKGEFPVVVFEGLDATGKSVVQ